MKFHGLLTYARQRGLSFEQIALRRIVLFSAGEWPYRETFHLTDGGRWIDAVILNYKF